MKTKEEAEEIMKEVKDRVGVLKNLLQFEVCQDCYCDGGGYYVRIQ